MGHGSSRDERIEALRVGMEGYLEKTKSALASRAYDVVATQWSHAHDALIWARMHQTPDDDYQYLIRIYDRITDTIITSGDTR